ncbi:SRPBCC family protein [Nocardia blacklockiae]|uniref:SRPBCC family protein n=1 Tax=Nocardia blacklockiae TaxID=480036 RepID=UPI00189555D1|nr:SRPBCC domain-containing protein [Nocardia blacklockiae]MBF6171563.1 SRPBCC domain-containing protein [Nocardia blacklockiae]
MADTITLERTYPTTAERVWELWTTADGIPRWWAPDGFEVRVDEIEVRAGGGLVYTMTATGPEQIEFMKSAGMPLATTSHKTFTEVEPVRRLAYTSLIDFVPGHDAYDHLTTVEFTPVADGVRVVMTLEPLHDEEWTQRIVAGRSNELDNLGKLVASE